MKRKNLVYGVGVVDVDYAITATEIVNGNQKITWLCPYYQKWSNMLSRCYSKVWIKGNPSYVGCTVDNSWLKLSNFIEWVDNQSNKDWKNCELDKDILAEGNKLYSKNTCVFVDRNLNKFTTDSRIARGQYCIGVSWHKASNKFMARCNNPFADYKGQNRYLGIYNTEIEAHKAWQAKKHEYACMLADLQVDERVSKVLKERYSPDKDWTKR